jgi:hypothetical protein
MRADSLGSKVTLDSQAQEEMFSENENGRTAKPKKSITKDLKRTRKAKTNELTFESVEAISVDHYSRLHCPAAGIHFVRHWRDSKSCCFYDCTCGHRRPTHDRRSILHHIQASIKSSKRSDTKDTTQSCGVDPDYTSSDM